MVLAPSQHLAVLNGVTAKAKETTNEHRYFRGYVCPELVVVGNGGGGGDGDTGVLFRLKLREGSIMEVKVKVEVK